MDGSLGGWVVTVNRCELQLVHKALFTALKILPFQLAQANHGSLKQAMVAEQTESLNELSVNDN